MLQCPGCGNTIPADSPTCQFCGWLNQIVAPPKPRAPKPLPRWVWAIYYFIAGLWMLDGLYGIVSGFGVFSGELDSASVAFGGFSVFVAGCLFTRNESVKEYVALLCGIKGFWALAMLGMLTIFSGLIGLKEVTKVAALLVVFLVADMGSAVAMVFITRKM